MYNKIFINLSIEIIRKKHRLPNEENTSVNSAIGSVQESLFFDKFNMYPTTTNTYYNISNNAGDHEYSILSNLAENNLNNYNLKKKAFQSQINNSDNLNDSNHNQV